MAIPETMGYQTEYQGLEQFSNHMHRWNNFGYAHLLHNDPQSAEPLLLLALVFEPGRATAWANLGQSYAKRGKRSEAVACFALAYRVSRNREVTRKFFFKLSEHEDKEVREAARQALQLQFVQANRK